MQNWSFKAPENTWKVLCYSVSLNPHRHVSLFSCFDCHFVTQAFFLFSCIGLWQFLEYECQAFLCLHRKTHHFIRLSQSSFFLNQGLLDSLSVICHSTGNTKHIYQSEGNKVFKKRCETMTGTFMRMPQSGDFSYVKGILFNTKADVFLERISHLC